MTTASISPSAMWSRLSADLQVMTGLGGRDSSESLLKIGPLSSSVWGRISAASSPMHLAVSRFAQS